MEGSGIHLSEHLADVLSCGAEEDLGGVTETVLTQWLLRTWGNGRGEGCGQTVGYSCLVDPVTH